MAIYDYQHIAETAKTKLFSRKDISAKNFEELKKFLKVYNVSPATEAIFFKHIGFLLCNTKDIRKDMIDRDKSNNIFAKLRKELSPSYYATVVNKSLRFVRWLNDGDKPKGFKDIQNASKKTQKRDLKESDMVTWEDGQEMIRHTQSLQFKAIIMVMLDGGFRPSEFIDLKKSDVEQDGKFFVCHVKGKTGKRNVILYKSAPYLNRWLRNHPDTKSNAPLWVMENASKSNKGVTGIVQYDYFAITKRVRAIGKKANIKKPLDFYNFRHSACRLAKLENLPTDLAAEKFGHSVEYYVGTYARLSKKDEVDRHKKAYGEGIKKAKEEAKPLLCGVCNAVNAPNSDVCEQCENPLTLKKALSEKAKIKQEMASQILELIKEKSDDLRKALNIKKQKKVKA